MKSIKVKLWTSMMVLILIVILLLWFFQIIFLESFYTEIKVSTIKRKGYEIIKQIENSETRDIEEKIDEFSYNENSNIQIINIERQSIYESIGGSAMDSKKHINGRMGKGNMSYLDFKELMNNKEIIKEYNHSKFGNKIMMIALPIVIDDEIIGAMIINMPIAPIQDTIYILKRQLIYITVILLIVSTAIAFFLAQMFTKPILEIQRVTKKIAIGDFSEILEIGRDDEIGRLGESINYMRVELSKIEQLRKDLIANVSHELRTPLSLIQGYAEMIRDVSGDNKDKRDKHVDIIVDESRRLSHIVDDILNLSQIQSGYVEMNKSEFSINELILSFIEKYKILSEKSGVGIESQLDRDIKIIADKSKIEQVLYNLVNNAFSHTNEGGEVRIITSINDGSVKVEIRDNGEGISEDDIENIWDRYYKNDDKSKRGNLGTGLGLSIVKNILELHESEYGVTSKEGVETIFWFILKTT